MSVISKRKFLGDWKLGKTIGQGAFSKVKLGTHRQTGLKVAVKIIDKKLAAAKAKKAAEATARREAKKAAATAAAAAAVAAATGVTNTTPTTTTTGATTTTTTTTVPNGAVGASVPVAPIQSQATPTPTPTSTPIPTIIPTITTTATSTTNTTTNAAAVTVPSSNALDPAVVATADPKTAASSSLGAVPTLVQRLSAEVQLLMRLDHPNIIRIYQVLESEDECYVIMEHATGGELIEYIAAKSYLSEKEARKFFRQMISAMDHCHSAHVVHRDLKLENLLLSAEKNLLISDFGLGRTFTTSVDDYMKTFCGTPNYAAVELISGIPYIGVKADIWAMGVVLFIMTSGKPPFVGPNITGLYAKIKSVDYTCPPHFSPDLRALLKKILVKDPTERTTLEGIRRDAWVNTDEAELPLRIAPKLSSNNVAELNSDLSHQLQQPQQPQQQRPPSPSQPGATTTTTTTATTPHQAENPASLAKLISSITNDESFITYTFTQRGEMATKREHALQGKALPEGSLAAKHQAVVRRRRSLAGLGTLGRQHSIVGGNGGAGGMMTRSETEEFGGRGAMGGGEGGHDGGTVNNNNNNVVSPRTQRSKAIANADENQEEPDALSELPRSVTSLASPRSVRSAPSKSKPHNLMRLSLDRHHEARSGDNGGGGVGAGIGRPSEEEAEDGEEIGSAEDSDDAEGGGVSQDETTTTTTTTASRPIPKRFRRHTSQVEEFPYMRPFDPSVGGGVGAASSPSEADAPEGVFPSTTSIGVGSTMDLGRPGVSMHRRASTLSTYSPAHPTITSYDVEDFEVPGRTSSRPRRMSMDVLSMTVASAAAANDRIGALHGSRPTSSSAPKVTMKDIEAFHVMLRPASKIRIGRFAFSVATTSAEAPSTMFSELYHALVQLQETVYPTLKFERTDKDYYMFTCRVNRFGSDVPPPSPNPMSANVHSPNRLGNGNGNGGGGGGGGGFEFPPPSHLGPPRSTLSPSSPSELQTQRLPSSPTLQPSSRSTSSKGGSSAGATSSTISGSNSANTSTVGNLPNGNNNSNTTAAALTVGVSGDEDVVFEVEVCKIWLLKLHGIRLKRKAGSVFLYKEITSHLIDVIHL